MPDPIGFLVSLFTVILPPAVLVLGSVYVILVAILLIFGKTYDFIDSFIPQRIDEVHGRHMSGYFERK